MKPSCRPEPGTPRPWAGPGAAAEAEAGNGAARSRVGGGATRRGLLAGGAVLLGLGGAAAVARLGGAAAAPGFGPVHLGQRRAAALRALGPGALPGPLCANAAGRAVEGVLFQWPDPALSDRPVPAMAMFGDGERVSEMQANLSRPEGGLELAAWRALARTQRDLLAARLGAPPEADPGNDPGEEDGAVTVSAAWRFRVEGARIALSARWMRRSGASFSALHWLAAEAEAVIAPAA